MRNEMTASEKKLTEHIHAENARRSAWAAEDPKNRFVCLMVEDIDHWRAYDIHSVEDYDRYMLVCEIVDDHKAAFGFKPSYADLMSLSMEDLRAEAAYVARSLKHEMEREYEMEAMAADEFESGITKAMKTGNIDRNTAIGWLLDAELDEDTYDMRTPSYLRYSLGLPVKYEKEFEKALNRA